MKKITLLVASILLFGSIANASTLINFSGESLFPVTVSEAEPIVFVERGIEFFVFPDGQFDFNTRPSAGEFYYRKASAVNRTYGTRNNIESNFGVKVEHDNFGRVRRVGNVFINYDANDRIKRIGSVYMTYNRFALAQVGGLIIVYNRRNQIINLIGSVKGNRFNDGYSYGAYDNGYNASDYYTTASTSSYNENDYYYYKGNGKKAKVGDKTPAKTTGRR